VAPSSRALARRLADLTFRTRPRVVVEIGAGSGAVTRELAARAEATGARLLAVELERSLARRAGHGLAVQAHAAWLPVARADVVVSGIPFASLPRASGHAILAEAARVAPRIVLFQYTNRRLELLEHHFPRVATRDRVRWNLPPAWAIEALRTA
jgi:phospholipid N-methyltransferase